MTSLYDKPARTPEDTAKIAAYLGNPDNFTDDVGAGTRLAFGASAAPAEAYVGLANSGLNLAHLLGASDAAPQQTVALPPSQSGLETTADLVSGLLPTALQIAATGGVGRAITGFTGLAESAPLLSKVATSAAEFGQLGLSQSPTMGAEQAAEGGLSGLIAGTLAKGSLPRMAASLALGLGSRAFINSQYPDAQVGGVSAGTIQGVALGAATAFLGSPFKTSHLPGEIPTKVVPPPTAEDLKIVGQSPDAYLYTNPNPQPVSPIPATTLPPEFNGAPSPVAAPAVPEAPVAPIPTNPNPNFVPAFTAPEQPALPVAGVGEPLINPIQPPAIQPSPLIAPETGFAVPPPSPVGTPELSSLPTWKKAMGLNPVVPETPIVPIKPTDKTDVVRYVLRDDGRLTPATATPESLQPLQTEPPVSPITYRAGEDAGTTGIDKAKAPTPDIYYNINKKTGEIISTATNQQDHEMNKIWDKSGGIPIESGFGDPTANKYYSPMANGAEGVVPNPKKGMLRAKPSWLSSEGGFTTPELNQALGRASFGAIVGGTAGALVDDPDSHTGLISGAAGGALLAMFGPALLKSALAESAAKVKPVITSSAVTTASTPRRTIGNLLAQARLNILTPNSATLSDRAFSLLDKQFNLSEGPSFSRILGQSSGAVAEHVNNVRRALENISLIPMDADTKKLVSTYLNGEISKPDFLTQMGQDGPKKAYADFATVARDAIGGIQEIGARGVGSEAKAILMKNTTNRYLTTAYRAFTDSSYSPSEDSITNLSKQIQDTGVWGEGTSLSQIQDGLRQWSNEVQQSKRVFSPRSDSLIDQNLFEHKKVLTQEWKDFLGEITDPVDRVRLTVMKLKPMAEASNFMDKVISGLNKSDEGLPFTYSTRGELEAARADILQRLQSSPSDPMLKRQQLELQQYKYVAPDANNGALQNRYVHRNVSDVLDDWASARKPDSALGRTVASINGFMKSNVTYRNPMSIMRQVLSTPFFLQIGRGWSETPNAMKILMNPDHPMYKEMVQNGITHVDSITKDVLRETDQLSGGLASIASTDGGNAYLGRIDGLIGKASAYGKIADNALANAFKFPDQVVRAASYLAAKSRIADRLNLPLDHTDVINAAIEHTNRYTMNYDQLPRAVMTGRKVPFVNMFISYASEMGRILKNVGEDLVKGDSEKRMQAIMSLGFAVALPEAMQSASESSLSPKDKEDWNKVKAGMPAYLKDRYYFVSGRDPKTKQFRVYDFTRILPADQFTQALRALSERRIADAAVNNPVVGLDTNPALNIASSLVLGQDRYSGKKFRDTSDRLAMVAKEVGGPLAPGGSTWRDAHLAFGTNDQGTTGITDKHGKSLSAADFWLPFATQIKAQNLNLDTIQQNAVADYKSNVANEIAYYNDVKKSNVSADVKQRAGQRATEAIKQLQQHLSRKLGQTQ